MSVGIFYVRRSRPPLTKVMAHAFSASHNLRPVLVHLRGSWPIHESSMEEIDGGPQQSCSYDLGANP